MAFDPNTAKLVKKFDPNTAVLVAPPMKYEPEPDVPLPEGWVKPTGTGAADPWARSASAAFREGYLKPRENDPFGLNHENRSFTAADIPFSMARAGLEFGESLYGGIKQGTGQLLYNMGASQSSPSVIANRAFELPEYQFMTSGTNWAGFAPRTASGLTLANQARRGVGLPAAPARVLSAEQQRKLDLYNLGQQYDTDLLPADIAGTGVVGGTLRGFTAGSGQTILGGPQVRAASTLASEQMGDALGRTARMQGQPLTVLELGEEVKRGGKTYVETSSARGNRLYNKARDAAGDLRIPTERAVNAVDKAILDVMKGGKAADDPAVLKLQGVRDRLTRFDDVGGMEFDGVRRVISDLGAEAFSPDMISNNLSSVLKNIRAEAREDLNTAVRRTGDRRTIKRLNDANLFWQNRVETVHDILEPIMGAGKSGEDVVAAIMQMAQGRRGGVRRLSGLFNALPPKAADNARATLIQTLGQAKAGAQGAEGGVFSPSTFLTNWNNMGPEGKNALVGNNPAVKRHLQNLARLAEARKATENLANTSSTARARNVSDYIERAARATAGAAQGAAYLGGAVFDLGTTLAFAALDYGAGRLLSSPEFARIVADASKTPAAAASSAARARVAKQLLALGARQAGFQPYINQIVERISNPTPPPFDYSKGDETSPTSPDYSKMSLSELEALQRRLVNPADDPYLELMGQPGIERPAAGPAETPAPDEPTSIPTSE